MGSLVLLLPLLLLLLLPLVVVIVVLALAIALALTSSVKSSELRDLVAREWDWWLLPETRTGMPLVLEEEDEEEGFMVCSIAGVLWCMGSDKRPTTTPVVVVVVVAAIRLACCLALALVASCMRDSLDVFSKISAWRSLFGSLLPTYIEKIVR